MACIEFNPDAVLGDEWKKFLRGGADISTLTPRQSYEIVPLLRRAVKLRTAALASMPFHVYRRGGSVEVPWPLSIPASTLFRRLETDLLVFGQAYLLRLPGRRLDVQRLTPAAVQVQYDPDTAQLSFVYNPFGGYSVTYTPDDVAYIWEHDLESDVRPGASTVMTALAAAKIMYAADLLLQVYYKSGGMPATLVISERGFGKDEDVVRTFFKRLLRGVTNAFRVLTLSGKVDVKTLTPPVADLALDKIDELALKRIAWAFGIPQTMLTDAANYATAREHRISFIRDTVIPEAEFVEGELNRQLFEPAGYRLEFAPQELEILQENELARARTVLTLVQAGVPLESAMTVAGYEEDQVPVLPAPGLPAGTEPGGAVQWRKELRAWHKVSRRKGAVKALEFEPRTLPPTLTRVVRSLLEKGLSVKASREDIEEEMAERLVTAWQPFADDAVQAWKRGDEYQFDADSFLAGTLAILAGMLGAAVEGRLVELSGDLGAFPFGDSELDELLEGVHSQARAQAQLIAEATERMVGRVNELVRQGMDEAMAMAHAAFIWGTGRANGVAITEITKSRSFAVGAYQQAFKRNNVQTERVWLTANDELVCPICGKYHQQPESVWKDDYPDGPPAHPRCRCDIALRVVSVGGESV